MKNKVTTLNDVAKEAGVCKSTVSRIINNKLGNGFSVKEEVRKRVLEVVRKLNYRPNLVARSLTLQDMRMIHVVGGYHALSDIGNIYQTVVNTMTKVLEEASDVFDVTVDMSSHPDKESELPSWRVGAVIVLAKCTPTTMKELEDFRIPYVVVNGPAGDNGLSIIPDDIGGTELAIKHLIEVGNHKIAYAQPFGVPLVGHRSIDDRHNCYLETLKNNGLKAIPGHDKHYDNAEKFLQETVIDNEATAILAYGHMGGLNLMQAAHSIGIQIPEKLNLLCFCDAYANDVMSPGLSFIDLRSNDMGQIAANKLLERINNSKSHAPEVIKIAEKLVLNSTTTLLKK